MEQGARESDRGMEETQRRCSKTGRNSGREVARHSDPKTSTTEDKTVMEEKRRTKEMNKRSVDGEERNTQTKETDRQNVDIEGNKHFKSRQDVDEEEGNKRVNSSPTENEEGEGDARTASTATKPEDLDDPGEEDSKTLSHPELKLYFQEALSRLIQSDPILADLHPQITPEEVNALIELEHGRAMRVYVEREGDIDGEGAWGLVVPREATVHNLKQSLRHHVALVLSRKGIKKRISWKYVWKNNWLSHEGEKLTDDHAKLLQYGVRNKSTLKFVKWYREKQRFGKRKR